VSPGPHPLAPDWADPGRNKAPRQRHTPCRKGLPTACSRSIGSYEVSE
jgi:hypothetical protein